jgi:hypothetical protein
MDKELKDFLDKKFIQTVWIHNQPGVVKWKHAENDRIDEKGN